MIRKSSLAVLLLLLPSFFHAQDLGKKLLKTLGDKAKQETVHFASKALSKDIAKALGFSSLQMLSRGDRSMSAEQKRNAQSAEHLFYATPPADNTRVNLSASGTSQVVHRYEVLTEADIENIEREFKPLLDRIQQEIDNPTPPDAIPVYAHQKRLIHFQGYCLDKGIAAPQTQDGFQLIATSMLFPEDAIPFYNGLLRYGQSSGRTNEVQGLIWRLVHGVNPEHEPTALYFYETQILDVAVPGGAAAFNRFLQGKYQQSHNSIQALYQKEGREIVQDAVNRYVNPVFGGSGISVNLYRQDLNGSAQIGDYLNSLAQLPIEGKVETGSEYTLLANQVAARSISTMDLHALSIEIANQSDQTYYYDPLQHVAFSTRMTQPIGHYPKEPQQELNGVLVDQVVQMLRFLQDHPEILKYTGYTLAGISALLLLPEIGVATGLVEILSAARLIVGNVTRLKNLRGIISGIFKGLRDKFKGNNSLNKGLKPLGLGSTGRQVPKNLNEELTMKEIMANPIKGDVIMEPLKDPLWLGWRKMQFIKTLEDGTKIVIHYVGKWENGVLKAIDDFKFINP